MAASGLVAATAMLKGGMSAAALWSPAMMASMGAAVIALTGLRLPGWARTRASQMEAFAETAARILEDAHIHVNGDVVRVSASEKEAREILTDLLGPHRIGSQEAFDAAVQSAAAAVADLEITAR